jgi:hypothetical protein
LRWSAVAILEDHRQECKNVGHGHACPFQSGDIAANSD